MGRYEDLIEKRDSEGLTDDEAGELGRLMAERQGEEYGNAQNPPPDVEVERVGTAEVTNADIAHAEEAKEAEKEQQAEKAEREPKGSEKRPEEERRGEPPKPGTEGPPPA